MSEKYIYFHNPKCSKSRQGLELLERNGITPQVKEYLKEGITKDEVLEIIGALGIAPLNGLIRTKEATFIELGLEVKNALSSDQWAEILSENLSLLERPILLSGKQAVIGRPIENLLKLIK